jgi:hypothetical protein
VVLLNALVLSPRSTTTDAKADKDNRYIYQLCPQYILSLLQTAYCHQQEALREAIWKHLTREASVRVHVPVSTYLVFETYVGL